MQIVVQNLLVNYQKKGKGQPFVLLHGWGADLNSFGLILPQLSEKYKVYALDWPGFGKTQKVPKDWFVDNYVEFLEEFLSKLKIKKAVFVGHSFGARVLIKFAVKNPDLCKKLILTGAAGIKPKNSMRKKTFNLVAKTGKLTFSLPGLKKLKKIARKTLYLASGTSDYLNAGKMKQTFLNVIQEDLTPYLKKIKTPTLLIWGKNDLDTPLEDAKKMQNLIQNSKLEIIQKAGHYVFVDQPKQFLSLC